MTMNLSETALEAAATYFPLGSGSSVTFHNPTRMTKRWWRALEDLVEAGLVKKEGYPDVGGVTYTSVPGGDMSHLAMDWLRKNPPWERNEDDYEPILHEEPKIWLLWGTRRACRMFATENGVRSQFWKHIDRMDRLYGREGLGRNPASPHELFVLPGDGWDGLTPEELDFARAMGFELTV